MIELFPFDRDDAATSAIDSRGRAIDVAAAVAAEARPGRPDRPWVYTNMVASADGGTAVDGVSGQLGGDADKAMFAALRSVADVILVGASTVREERYRAPRRPDEVRARRLADGRSPDPRLVVVTRSLDLDPDLPLFAEPDNRPLVVTTSSAPAERRAALEPVAELLDAGRDGVDLALTLRELARRGARTALSEGGPSINGQLVADDLIDEWNLSLSPRLLGGDSRRAAIGPVAGGPTRTMRLARVWTDDEFLFCRWLRAR